MPGFSHCSQAVGKVPFSRQAANAILNINVWFLHPPVANILSVSESCEDKQNTTCSSGVVHFNWLTEPVICFPGYPSLSGTGTVIVVVADANDNVPVFDHANYDARVVENQPSGTIVFQPRATDRDAGRNAELRFMEFNDCFLKSCYCNFPFDCDELVRQAFGHSMLLSVNIFVNIH